MSEDDPIESFLTDQEYYGRSERTLTAYRRVLREFETFLEDPTKGPRSTTPAAAARRDCMAWINSLRETHAQSTVATYAAYVHRFYAYLVQLGVFEANPMAIVTDEIDETIEKDPTRREIAVPEMRRFLETITHPLHRALIVTLLKTGIRVGELCNLDLRDVNLEQDLIDTQPRGSLTGRGQTLYVPAGSQLPGDRTAANKRKRETIIPVDDELAAVLTAWLAIRPDTTSRPAPLFVSTESATKWGKRLHPDDVRRILRTYTKDVGWYTEGAGPGENVTPHYFRHFFTTHLRDRTGDRGIVKYLRGDVAEDIIDTYTHNWNDRVREVYLGSIYRLDVA